MYVIEEFGPNGWLPMMGEWETEQYVTQTYITLDDAVEGFKPFTGKPAYRIAAYERHSVVGEALPPVHQ